MTLSHDMICTPLTVLRIPLDMITTEVQVKLFTRKVSKIMYHLEVIMFSINNLKHYKKTHITCKFQGKSEHHENDKHTINGKNIIIYELKDKILCTIHTIIVSCNQWLNNTPRSTQPSTQQTEHMLPFLPATAMRVLSLFVHNVQAEASKSMDLFEVAKFGVPGKESWAKNWKKYTHILFMFSQWQFLLPPPAGVVSTPSDGGR